MEYNVIKDKHGLVQITTVKNGIFSGFVFNKKHIFNVFNYVNYCVYNNIPITNLSKFHFHCFNCINLPSFILGATEDIIKSNGGYHAV